MQSFIEEILNDVLQNQDAIEDLVFILPSKRAGTFLKNTTAKTCTKTIFSPEIYSIENFVEKISGLAYANNTEQLFELYGTYLKHISGEKDNFHDFSKWAPTLLQDFNEIDRHLIDSSMIFSNLSDILEINHWSPQFERTQMMEDYLHFWKHIDTLYHNFNRNLIVKGLGHQGLIYRHASDNLDKYMSQTRKTHIFMGFNALNTAESLLIQRMLSAQKAYIYWDIDSYFLDDPIHDAGFFIRKYLKSWKYFEEKPLQGISSSYNSVKDIQIIGVPKNISQAKYVGNLLKKLHSENPKLLKNTAVVLGDETLLNPLLNSIPIEIEAVNITMGYPLHKTPLANLFEQFIQLYITKDAQGWYHQNITGFLSHQFIQIVLKEGELHVADHLVQQIKTKNLTHVSPEKIKSLVKNVAIDIELLFFEDQLSPQSFVERCSKIILEIKSKIKDTNNSLTLEYLYRFHNLFNQIFELIKKYDFITDLKSLHSLYKELLLSETMDFRGDPLEGLQIMGMLESRNLDFETVIITSVNEGILPSGKSNNSFIPFDLKVSFGLPTYKEKDAVYTYHFYRLLQRAKNIYILYNTEPDVIEGGEKSRLITQLLTDENKSEDITAIIATPKINPFVKELEFIHKDEGLLEMIKGHAKKGFSPSSLSNYIRNPIAFYKQNLLGIDDSLVVEETVASNTFGTIIHDSLEDLYRPLMGRYLSKESLQTLKTKIEATVRHHFSKSYFEGDISRGKNLIAFNVIIKYLENFIELEMKDIEHHKIKIIGLEEKLQLELGIPEIDFPVFLKGKIDRIDEFDGQLRIIDYKTGNVALKDVEIVYWQDIVSEYDFSKAFQLLCYALMFRNKYPFDKIEAGIIPIKALGLGLLKFAVKDKKGSRNKDSEITKITLELFQSQLKALIQEICNPQIPFTEKEV